jgi:hypothetical protein
MIRLKSNYIRQKEISPPLNIVLTPYRCDYCLSSSLNETTPYTTEPTMSTRINPISLCIEGKIYKNNFA